MLVIFRRRGNILDRCGDALAVDEMRYAVRRQPFVLWYDEVGNECKDRNSSHDDRCVCMLLAACLAFKYMKSDGISKRTVQISTCHGKFPRRV